MIAIPTKARPAGSIGQPQYKLGATDFGGMSGINWDSATTTWTFGSAVSVKYTSTAGGAITVQAPAIAGNAAITWPGVTGTLTTTATMLTANALLLGNGGTDTKVSTGITSNGIGEISLGVSATTAGAVNFYGSTSGLTRLKAPAVAVTGDVVLPGFPGTLATLGQNTFTGLQFLSLNQNAATTIQINNTNNGNAAQCTFAVFNDMSDRFSCGIYSSGSTPYGTIAPRSAFNYTLSPNGLVLMADNASGTVRIAAGGNAERVRIATDGSLTGTTNISLGATAASPDWFITRPAAASAQLGAADSASPTAQTTQVQSVVAGTSNINGQPWTFNGSKSTGTGVGGDIVFKTAPAGSSGSAQNATAEHLRIGGAGTVTVTGLLVSTGAVTASSGGVRTVPVTVGTLPSAAASGDGTRNFVNDATMTSALGIGTAVVGGGANKVGVIVANSTWVYG